MWFLFGFVTFISATIYISYKRIDGSWKGNSYKKGSIHYQLKTYINKGKARKVLLGVEGPQGLHFMFKKETAFDRLCKSIGLSKEFQVGDDKFDQLVYIVSDSQTLHSEIQKNIKILALVPALFQRAKKHACEVKKLKCRSGRLWLELKPSKGFVPNNSKPLADDLIPSLKEIAENLSSSMLENKASWKDPFVLKAIIILSISSGLAINGGIHLMRLFWNKVPFTIDSSELFYDALLLGGVITLALMFVTLGFLGRTARTHIVLIELLLVGSFGAFATSFTELRDYNMEMDTSQSIRYEVTLHNKQKVRSRRSTNYYLYVDDWTKKSSSKKLRVSNSFYSRVKKGDPLSISQRDGYLGYRWVESLSKVQVNGR